MLDNGKTADDRLPHFYAENPSTVTQQTCSNFRLSGRSDVTAKNCQQPKCRNSNKQPKCPLIMIQIYSRTPGSH